MRSLAIAMGLLAAALLGVSSAAHGQQINCNDYADRMEAMERARTAIGPLAEDQEWTAHRSWCAGAPSDHPRAHFERQIRDFHAFARSVSIRHLNPDFRCDTYAIASDAFEVALEELGCPIQAFTTDEHRNWCEAGNRDEAVNHLTNRRQNLLRCIAGYDYQGPGGGGRDFSNRPSAPAAAPALPQGSYLRTCRNGAVEDGVLYAECESRNGAYYATSVFLGAYSGPISNCDGQLRLSASC